MTDYDLLDHVVPKGGIYSVVGMKEGKPVPRFTDSLEEAHEIADAFSEQGLDVYFALGKLKEKGNRRVDNVESLGAIWLDIDCGGDKAEKVEVSTGLPQGYADRKEGGRALASFSKTIGLPEPVIVNSGYGLHVYWAFTEEVPTEKWQPIANRLKDICVTQKFCADPRVFDAARILRVPGTFNHKGDSPREVVVRNPNTKRYTPDSIRELLGVDSTLVVKKKSNTFTPNALEKLFDQNTNYKFSKIVGRKDPCLQLKDSLINRDTLIEPRWFDALSVAKFCDDGAKAVHSVSIGHPDYDYAAVERKIVGIKGPHSCEEFEKNNPDGCKKCVHKKSKELKGPYNLGKIVKKAASSPINKFEPYFRGQNGGVYKKDGDDAQFIYDHDFYLKKQMWDDVDGYQSVFVFHSPHDGVREFSIPNDGLEKRLLIRTLAKNGVVAGISNQGLLHEYVTTSIRLQQQDKASETMRRQFGWADNDTKFIVGEREITVDGVYHSPASSVTKAYVGYCEPRGTLEKWQEVFNLYNKKGLEVQAFAALSGFGSPLLKITGQSGAVISLVHKNAGTGKTTVLRMANSIYGHPKELLGKFNDTQVARINKLGILNNVVHTVDELSNMDGEGVSNFAYEISQGKGKEKGRADISGNRENYTTWNNITLTTANSPFYQRLMAKKGLPEGELMRIIEFNVEHAGEIITENGKDLFDRQLNENYGHAIVPFIQYIIANPEKVKTKVIMVQNKIDKELRLTPRERNWSAIIAANIAGGLIANQLGIIKFNMKRIYKKAAELIQVLREETTAPVDSYVSVLGAFIVDNFNKLLIVNGEVDQRSQKQASPILEPKWGELVLRYEPDTKKLFIPVKKLRDTLDKDYTDYKAFIKDLGTRGIYIETVNKRMSKGMAFTAPAQRCVVFDTAHSEFIDMEKVVEKVKEDADREGGIPDQLEKI